MHILRNDKLFPWIFDLKFQGWVNGLSKKVRWFIIEKK
jgi:hypothetical protein